MFYVATRNARSLAAAVLFLTCSVFAWAGGPSGSAQPPKAVQQTGTLTINGCTVQAKDISLTARPMVVAMIPDANTDDVSVPDSWDLAPDSGKSRVRRAHVSATKDPHVFTFVFHALKVTKLYTIGAMLATNACGQVSWMGPSHGVIQPGAISSLQLNGYSVTTQIDVESTDAAGNTFFRGSDALTDDSLIRRFRWHTTLPGVTDVELQIAADKFLPNLETPDTCGTPTNLLTTALLHGTTANNFSGKVDFYQVLIGGNEGAGGGDVEFNQPISDAVRYAFRNGAPLYVRAIPLRADGTRMCNLLTDGVSAYSVVLLTKHFAALKGEPSLLVSGDYHPAIPPAPFDYCVTSVTPHLAATSLYVPGTLKITDDWLGFAYYAAGLTDANHVVQPGTFYCWNHQSSTFFDDVGNFISGFIDAIAMVVNYIADLYNSIKADIVNWVASAIDAIGIPCDGTCKELINTALSTALTAMGLPPSLPNFDELVNDGIDYLKEQVAEQAGIPQFAVDQVVDTVIDAAKNQGAGGGGGLPNWVVADNGFRPARVVVNALPNITKLPNVPYWLGIHSDPGGLFTDVNAPLPYQAMSKGTSFRIPMQLAPDLNGTADAPCYGFITTNCNSLWPPDFVLKLKLTDWYNSRFAPSSCSQFGFAGDHGGGSVEDLGTRQIVPPFDSSLGGADTYCQ